MNKIILIVLLFASLAAAEDPEQPPTATEVTTPKPEEKCGINEKYDCRWNCDSQCATMGQPCYSFGFWCASGCYCIEGHARDFQGICIPIKMCPGRTVCPENEVYDTRIPNCPIQRDCYSLLNGDRECEDPIEYYASCRCRSGYVREDYKIAGSLKKMSKCVRKSKCCKDPNTMLVRDSLQCLGNTCQQPYLSNCTELVKEWDCQCRDGFVKVSDKNSTCINWYDC
ncbi:uncharacterized protein LOC143912830 [Arctopsyche grandis]|uniref:uncharacterized protein LOC143912830 n=1 Tax=Arctopsyche grandis TaxID=121162 RepID=UPI00406D941B